MWSNQKVNARIIHEWTFALPHTSVDLHSKSRQPYRISATLFQIFDSNSKHVGGTSPTNLDSERGWKILRERCDVYPCVSWKHRKLCRSDVLLYSARSHLSIPMPNWQRKRVSVSCKGGGIAASFLALLAPRVEVETDCLLSTEHRMHGEISYM